MNTILGLICEATARRDGATRIPIPYCNMDPWVFFEIGFEKGPSMERIEARLIRKESSVLVSNFLALCRSDGPLFEVGISPCFKGSPLFSLDSSRGLITTGDYILKNGCGGRAATMKGYVREGAVRSGPAPVGSIVMLPTDTDPTCYNSIFCILTKSTDYIEGRIIGRITKGLDVLQFIVWKYGSSTGTPREKLIIQNYHSYSSGDGPKITPRKALKEVLSAPRCRLCNQAPEKMVDHRVLYFPAILNYST
ncbi:hypothetical protein Q1695_003262 [Nippostrongylus brasiliensis]|nr:hypothetical protein Q1695_003262 [Nippostrongylus brasiliensis]